MFDIKKQVGLIISDISSGSIPKVQPQHAQQLNIVNSVGSVFAVFADQLAQLQDLLKFFSRVLSSELLQTSGPRFLCFHSRFIGFLTLSHVLFRIIHNLLDFESDFLTIKLIVAADHLFIIFSKPIFFAGIGFSRFHSSISLFCAGRPCVSESGLRIFIDPGPSPLRQKLFHGQHFLHAKIFREQAGMPSQHGRVFAHQQLLQLQQQ